MESLKYFLIDGQADYRRELSMWKVDEHGNLVWLKNKFGANKSYYVIEKERLDEGDWLSHMKTKLDTDEFGEFVCAYFKACEMAGIREVIVNIYGFNDTCKFADKS